MPSPSDDTIDSREVIAEIEELESAISCLRDDIEDLINDNEELELELDELGEDEESQLRAEDIDAAISDNEDDINQKEIEIADLESELQPLTDLRDEAEPYCPDWRYGATLIADDYFEDYAYELANDIGAIPDDMSWPANCIDWTKAADALKMDYTSVDFDGTTYWIRS